MEDIIKESVDFLYSGANERTDCEYELESIDILDRYIDYLEDIVLQMLSDIGVEESKEGLREEFAKEINDD